MQTRPSQRAVEPVEAIVYSGAEIEAAMTKLGTEAGAGLMVMRVSAVPQTQARTSLAN